jgi:peptidoglycan/xylan/chitin deacetylase (PgdA/CDA1 family)
MEIRAGKTFPSYLDIAVPRALEFFKKRGLIITFFVVGQDAALEKITMRSARSPERGTR